LKTCIACGMPMKDISDFAANDPTKIIVFTVHVRRRNAVF